MKNIIVKSDHAPTEVLSGIPYDIESSVVIERWQKRTHYYLFRGRVPSCTWKVAESVDIVDALIESASF